MSDGFYLNEIERNLDSKFGELNQAQVRFGRTLKMGGTASLDASAPSLIVPTVNWVEIGLTLFERGAIPGSPFIFAES